MQLFWRCSVALLLMPLPQLSALSQRKRPFLRSADEALPGEGASSAEARLAHIRLNLPVFAMVARLPPEDRPEPQAPEAELALAGVSGDGAVSLRVGLGGAL